MARPTWYMAILLVVTSLILDEEEVTPPVIPSLVSAKLWALALTVNAKAAMAIAIFLIINIF